jgi:hypothetical protein
MLSRTPSLGDRSTTEGPGAPGIQHVENSVRPWRSREGLCSVCHDCDGRRRQMLVEMIAVCRASSASKRVREKCSRFAVIYFGGLRQFGRGVFRERQRQVCRCSLGDFPEPSETERVA